MSITNPLIPYCGIRPGYLVQYAIPSNGYSRSSRQQAAMKFLEHNKPDGIISKKAERRISQAIDWLLWLSHTKTFISHKTKRQHTFKINFVTLTLPSKQIHSDNEIKSKCLNYFLVEARRKWQCVHYLWRAEAQKNGNIHFHVVFDKFIPWSSLRDTWNKCVNTLGYTERYKEKNGNKNPNSTDVHSVFKVKNISRYLAKYCTKNSTNRLIEGKLWGLSQSLSKMKSAVIEIDNQVYKELMYIEKRFEKSVRVKDFFSCVYTKVEKWANVVKGKLWECFSDYVAQFKGSAPDYNPMGDFDPPDIEVLPTCPIFAKQIEELFGPIPELCPF